jgi:hypothetical protein
MIHYNLHAYLAYLRYLDNEFACTCLVLGPLAQEEVGGGVGGGSRSQGRVWILHPPKSWLYKPQDLGGTEFTPPNAKCTDQLIRCLPTCPSEPFTARWLVLFNCGLCKRIRYR